MQRNEWQERAEFGNVWLADVDVRSTAVALTGAEASTTSRLKPLLLGDDLLNPLHDLLRQALLGPGPSELSTSLTA